MLRLSRERLLLKLVRNKILLCIEVLLAKRSFRYCYSLESDCDANGEFLDRFEKRWKLGETELTVIEKLECLYCFDGCLDLHLDEEIEENFYQVSRR